MPATTIPKGRKSPLRVVTELPPLTIGEPDTGGAGPRTDTARTADLTAPQLRRYERQPVAEPCRDSGPGEVRSCD